MKQRLTAAAIAAGHSLWITGLAIVLALIAGAAAAGQTGTPAAFLVYIQAQGFHDILVGVIAPAIRGVIAAKKGT